MSLNISKRRSSSIVPVVSQFNNWFSKQEKKPSSIKTRETRYISTSFYRSTLPVNPENASFCDTEKQPFHNRTHSSYRNTQSRLNITKDDLQEMLHEITYLTERAKKTRLDVKMMRKQTLIDLEQKEQCLKQQIFGLRKLVNYSIKDQQNRRAKIKLDISDLKDNYRSMKDTLNYIGERLKAVQNQCGFANFNSSLYN